MSSCDERERLSNLNKVVKDLPSARVCIMMAKNPVPRSVGLLMQGVENNFVQVL